MRKFIKIFKRIMFVILLFIIVLVTAFYFYTKLPKFGSVPQGDRLAAVEKSPHYKNGKFRNIEEKPHLSKGYSTIGQLFKTLFYDYPHREPLDSLPSIKTDLKHIPKHANVLVWFGHSSFFLQLDSVKIFAFKGVQQSTFKAENTVMHSRGFQKEDIGRHRSFEGLFSQPKLCKQKNGF